MRKADIRVTGGPHGWTWDIRRNCGAIHLKLLNRDGAVFAQSDTVWIDATGSCRREYDGRSCDTPGMDAHLRSRGDMREGPPGLMNTLKPTVFVVDDDPSVR